LDKKAIEKFQKVQASQQEKRIDHMLQRLKKEKILMNVDRQVKDIESELRTKQ
jgi:hypothetical protein